MKILILIFSLMLITNCALPQSGLHEIYAGSIYFLRGNAKVYYELIDVKTFDLSKEAAVKFVYDEPAKFKDISYKVTSIVYYIKIYCDINKISIGTVNYFRDNDLLSCSRMDGEIKYDFKYYQYILPFMKEIC